MVRPALFSVRYQIWEKQ